MRAALAGDDTIVPNFGAVGAVAFANIEANGAPIFIPWPAGVAVGDLLFAVIFDLVYDDTPIPAGWTRRTAFRENTYIYTATYAAGLSNTFFTGNSNFGGAGFMFNYHNTQSSFDGTITTEYTTGSPFYTYPTKTPSLDYALHVCFGIYDTASSAIANVTLLQGFTQRVNALLASTFSGYKNVIILDKAGVINTAQSGPSITLPYTGSTYEGRSTALVLKAR